MFQASYTWCTYPCLPGKLDYMSSVHGPLACLQCLSEIAAGYDVLSCQTKHVKLILVPGMLI